MISIYYMRSCPYCIKTINFIENSNLKKDKDYQLIEADRSSKEREKVIDLGGKSQVPFLEDTQKNIKMYESNDIIRYITQNYLNEDN